MAFLTGGANTLAPSGFSVDNSCRFALDAYATKTPGSSGSRRTFAISFWVKKCGLTEQCIFYSRTGTDGNNSCNIRFQDTQKLAFTGDATSVQFSFITNRLFRDPSAWYHICYLVDTTQATEANRFKLYVNGVQETSFATATYPSQNADLQIATTSHLIYVGAQYDSSAGSQLNSYLSEFVYLDAQTPAVTDFGEFDEDSPAIWKPKKVSGLTFGTNGFYLDFEASDNLGNDANGGTDLTETNLAAADQATDTPTNNFATFNPLASVTDAPTFSEGNCLIAIANAGVFGAASTIGMTAGKWYCEMKLVATSDDDGGVGIISDFDDARQDVPVGETAGAYGYKEKTGNKINNNSEVSYGDAYNSAGDIIGIALDLDNLKIYFAKNGTWQASGDPTSGATGTNAAYTVTAPASTVAGAYFFIGSCYSTSQSNTWGGNFGGCPPFAISSGNADADGYGNFEYAPPSGYFALCTKNLAEYGG